MPKKPTSIFLDEELIKKLDEWRVSQSIFVSRTAVITYALQEFLKRNKVKFFDPMEAFNESKN